MSPTPTGTVAVPILLADEHVPAFACASAHWVTAGIAPTRPGGRTVLTFCTYWLPSPRVTFRAKDVCPPPFSVSFSVLWASENGSAPSQPVTDTPNAAFFGLFTAEVGVKL